MIIIGITGTLGAGKGAVVDYLVKEKGFIHFPVRGYLAKVITARGEEVNRDTLTRTANELRQANNPAFIIEELYRKASETQKNCIIESIRTPGEISSLREKTGFFLLAVDANIEIRYQRIRLRGSETDHIDFETFMQNEEREMNSSDPNKQNLAECIRQADFLIINNGTIDKLNQQVERILEKILHPL